MEKCQIANICLLTTNVITVCWGIYYVYKNSQHCPLDIDVDTIDPNVWLAFCKRKVDEIPITDRTGKTEIWKTTKEVWSNIVYNTYDDTSAKTNLDFCIETVNNEHYLDKSDALTAAMCVDAAVKYMAEKK
jgi:hypothetical protein